MRTRSLQHGFHSQLFPELHCGLIPITAFLPPQRGFQEAERDAKPGPLPSAGVPWGVSEGGGAGPGKPAPSYPPQRQSQAAPGLETPAAVSASAVHARLPSDKRELCVDFLLGCRSLYIPG